MSVKYTRIQFCSFIKASIESFFFELDLSCMCLLC